MLTGDVSLRHFRKGMYHSGDRQLHTLISYVLLAISITCMSNSLPEYVIKNHTMIKAEMNIPTILIFICNFSIQMSFLPRE